MKVDMKRIILNSRSICSSPVSFPSAPRIMEPHNDKRGRTERRRCFGAVRSVGAAAGKPLAAMWPKLIVAQRA